MEAALAPEEDEGEEVGKDKEIDPVRAPEARAFAPPAEKHFRTSPEHHVPRCNALIAGNRWSETEILSYFFFTGVGNSSIINT